MILIELLQLDSFSKEAFSSKLRAALDLAKTQHDYISKLEAELTNVKLTFAEWMNQANCSSSHAYNIHHPLPSKSSLSKAIMQVPFLARTKILASL